MENDFHSQETANPPAVFESMPSSMRVLPPPTVTAPQATVLPTIDFEGFFHTLARRKWTLLAMMILSLGLALAYLRVASPVYEASAQLVIGTEKFDVTGKDPIDKEDYRSIDALKTIEQAFTSTSLMERVIEKANLNEIWPGSRAMQIGRLQQHTHVELVRGTRAILIRYRGSEPVLTAKIVEAYLSEFQAAEFERDQGLTTSAKEKLESKEKEAKERLDESQRELESFREQFSHLDLGEMEDNLVTSRLKDSNAKLTEARSKRLQMEADRQTLANAATRSTEELLKVASIAALPEIEALMIERNNQEAAFAALKERYLPKHPDYIAAETTLKKNREALATRVKAAVASLERDYEVARDAESKLKAEMEAQQEVSSEREKIAAEYNRLKAETERDREALQYVSTRRRETELGLGMATSNVSVRDRPIVPEYPIWPVKPFILALGLFGGLMSGCALSLALELCNRKVRDDRDATKLMGNVTCLTKIPVTRLKTARDRLVMLSDPQSPSAEAFRTLRTSLYFVNQGYEPRTVMFTSATSGEGKSFSALNCAASYALRGHQTLLIEADLRCPTLEASLLDGNNRGLGEFLRGRAEPNEICYPAGPQGLYFIPAGELRPNPAELLASNYLPELLFRSLEYFDKIIIDAAPLLPVSDALVVGRLVEAICIVIRSKVSRKDDVSRSLKILESAGKRPAGYVLNGFTSRHVDGSYMNYINHQQHRIDRRAMSVPSLPQHPVHGHIAQSVAIL